MTIQNEWENLVCLVKMKENKKKRSQDLQDIAAEEEASHKVTRTSIGSELHHERFSHEEITASEALEQTAWKDGQSLPTMFSKWIRCVSIKSNIGDPAH